MKPELIAAHPREPLHCHSEMGALHRSAVWVGMTLIERFEAKFDVSPGCWNWKATISTNGYGGFTFKREKVGAHRMSYEFYIGAIPAGLHVLHRCDNRRCVNPGHLFLGTNDDNVRDRQEKGRMPRGDALSYSKLTEESVRMLRVDSRGATAIARELGVSPRCVRNARRGDTWGHV